MLVSEEFNGESSRLDRNAGWRCMFKDFAFKTFELYEIGVARLATSRAVIGFFQLQTLSGQSMSRKSSVFPFRNVRFGVSSTVWGMELYKGNVSSPEE